MFAPSELISPVLRLVAGFGVGVRLGVKVFALGAFHSSFKFKNATPLSPSGTVANGPP